MTSSPPHIAVFDSGFGGLTVLRALISLIPQGRYIYLGDTARLPYGSKSQETIARYALSAGHFLLDQGADVLVVACNTATALALPDLQSALPIPVIGVIQPGTQAALALSCSTDKSVILDESIRSLTAVAIRGPAFSPKSTVLVLATAATVQSHAYTTALNTLGLHAYEKACPLLVPLVEEGWTDHPVTAEVLRIYLTEALAEAPDATTLVLGCTHYPLLQSLIVRTLKALGRTLHIVDAAQATAQVTASLLSLQPSLSSSLPPTCSFYATDSIEKFQRLGSRFLGQPVPEVHLVDLGG